MHEERNICYRDRYDWIRRDDDFSELTANRGISYHARLWFDDPFQPINLIRTLVFRVIATCRPRDYDASSPMHFATCPFCVVIRRCQFEYGLLTDNTSVKRKTE